MGENPHENNNHTTTTTTTDIKIPAFLMGLIFLFSKKAKIKDQFDKLKRSGHHLQRRQKGFDTPRVLFPNSSLNDPNKLKTPFHKSLMDPSMIKCWMQRRKWKALPQMWHQSVLITLAVGVVTVRGKISRWKQADF